MFESLGRAVHRLRWLVLALAAAFVVLGGAWGTQVADHLRPGGFTHTDSESADAQRVLEDALGRDATDILVLYRSDTMTVDDPCFAAAVRDTVRDLPKDLVSSSADLWSTRSQQFASTDRHATYVALRLASDDDGRQMDIVDELQPKLDAPGLTEQVGGQAAVNRDVSDQVGEDLTRAEAISLPVVFVLLV
ncbi:MAG: MMPL family transporter, partial [Streptosporangiales bacterium]|nr:MMPL family transporter [Streptosporangiales bacterium]